MKASPIVPLRPPVRILNHPAPFPERNAVDFITRANLTEIRSKLSRYTAVSDAGTHIIYASVRTIGTKLKGEQFTGINLKCKEIGKPLAEGIRKPCSIISTQFLN